MRAEIMKFNELPESEQKKYIPIKDIDLDYLYLYYDNFPMSSIPYPQIVEGGINLIQEIVEKVYEDGYKSGMYDSEPSW